MPRYLDINADGERVVRYSWPAVYETPTPEMNDLLREWRKAAIKDRDEMIAAQKACGRNDQEGARFFKAEAQHHLRLQRACTLMLPWLGEPDGGQEPIAPKLWPVELYMELDEISGRIIMLATPDFKPSAEPVLSTPEHEFEVLRARREIAEIEQHARPAAA